jgi:hypothetical protein
MVTEMEYTRALNKRCWSLFFKRHTPVFVFAIVAGLYSKHCDLSEQARCNYFQNKSKMFGGLKNPQY